MAKKSSKTKKGLQDLVQVPGNVQDVKPAPVAQAEVAEVVALPRSTEKSLRIQVGQTFCPIMGCDGTLRQWGVRKNEDGSISRKFQCPDCGQVSYSLERPKVEVVEEAADTEGLAEPIPLS